VLSTSFDSLNSHENGKRSQAKCRRKPKQKEEEHFKIIIVIITQFVLLRCIDAENK
jgi:hypothetical protein